MIETKSMKQPFSLKLSSSLFVVIWCLIASFPIIWIAVMSIKLPIDAFSSNPIAVIFGPITSNQSCLLYTSPSPRDRQKSRMPSSA